MAVLIGPNFGNEMIAAGLGGLPIAWQLDGTITYAPSITAEQRAATEAVFAATDPSLPKPQIAAAAMLVSGIVLSSASNPSLDGSYAANAAGQQAITSEAVYVAATGKFTNGQSTRGWPDASSPPVYHVFDPPQFLAFAEAVASFVDAVATAIAACLPSGKTWSPPSNAYAIP